MFYPFVIFLMTPKECKREYFDLMTPNRGQMADVIKSKYVFRCNMCPDWRIWQNQLIKACIYRGNGTCKYVCRCVPLKVQLKIKAEISLSASNKNFVFVFVFCFFLKKKTLFFQY